MSDLQAIVREIDGQLVLDDPAALAMVRALNKHNCANTLQLNADRVAHFKNRSVERGWSSEQAVIVLVNVDDVNGKVITDVLMPNSDWQVFRDRGETPFARGLADRALIQIALYDFDEEAACRLRHFTGLAVVVVDHGVAEIFLA